MVEATARRVFSNAHTYHINSISVNSDNETYLSADDLRINLWNLEITDRSFSILTNTSVWGGMTTTHLCASTCAYVFVCSQVLYFVFVCTHV